MIYGYVNTYKGETENFLNGRKCDKIVYCNSENPDLSFLEIGDTLVVYELKSVCKNLKEFLEFSQFISQKQIDIYCIDNESNSGNAFIDTKTAIGKVIINILSALNDFDNKYFQNM